MSPDLGGAVQCGVSKFGPAYSGKQVYVSTDMTLSQQSDFVHPSGYGCLVEDDPNQGQCAAHCDANGPCVASFSCDESLKVCIGTAAGENRASSGSSGGCALAGGSEPAAIPWTATALALLLARRRRRMA